MRIITSVALGLLLVISLFGQEGFSTQWIDTSVDPCTNFYQYACGVWMEKNPIPGDQTSWGRFNELNERNLETLREILDESSAAGAGRTQVEQQIGDFYGACMDEEAIEKLGSTPIQPQLARISTIENKAEISSVLAGLHRSGIGALFRFGSMPDLKNASVNTADVDQGGLGLPDRDYYFREDATSEEQRQKYIEHVRNMFGLLGETAPAAAQKAEAVMRIETALAEGSLDNVNRRDPKQLDHKMALSQLQKLSPSFNWKTYLQEVGAPPIEDLNVSTPDFVKTVGKIIDSEDLEDLRTYLSWRLLSNSADLLSRAFVDEDFNFYSKTLRGAKEIRPRWKRCVRFTDGRLGEALGQKYVEKAFPPEARKRMLDLVAGIEKALEADIDQLPWMTAPTKKKAVEKLHAIRNKIGYPEKWRDYSKLKIARDDALGNFHRAAAHDRDYDLAKIGKKVDREEWHMTPPTVNAYYHPMENNINFPAGILQPPFFDFEIDDPVNYGGIGAVIAHELTHGFDDQGRQFDAKGNLNDWWNEDDASAFERKAQCFIDQYASYTAVEDVKVNGKLTLGENIADNGGLRISFMALMDTLEGTDKKKVDGFSPEQRFFLGWSQVWCTNMTGEMLRMQAQTDPHAASEFRVNGVVSNMPEFRKAFSCRESRPMVRENACKVW